MFIITGCGGSNGGNDNDSTKTEIEPTKEGLVIVKQFITDLRTWGTAIKTDAGPDHDVFQTQINMATQSFDTYGGNLRVALERAFRVVRDAYLDGVTSASLADYLPPGTGSGAVTVSGQTVTLVGEIYGQNIEELIVVMPDLSFTNTEFTINVTSASLDNEFAILDIQSGKMTIHYDEEVNLTPWVEGSTTIPFPDPHVIDLSFQATMAALQHLPELIDPVTFSGSFNSFLLIMRNDDGSVYYDTYGDTDYNPSSVSLEGSFSRLSGESFDASLNVTMSNADSFRPTPSDGVLEPVAEENETNFREIMLSLSFVEKLPELPEARFTLTAHRDEFKAGDVSVLIEYGAKSIDANARIDQQDVQGKIIITNDEGVRLVFIPDATAQTATLTYARAVYGTVEKTSSSYLIRFFDGSFESF